MSSWTQSIQTIVQLFHGSSGALKGGASGEGSSRFWNGATMDELLEKKDWYKLVSHIYNVLDNHHCREAADWVKVHAEGGHVALLYVYLRNGVKYIGRRVLRTQEFNYWVKVWVYLTFRCVEDSLTCYQVMGLKKTSECLALIQKTMRWLSTYESFDEWPTPREILADMNVLEKPYASPAWIPGFDVAKVGHSVYFDTGAPDVLRACTHNDAHFSETQAGIRGSLLKEMSGVDTWEAFMKVIHRKLLDV